MKLKEYKNKTILKGMNLDEIAKWCNDQSHSSFRATQIYQWMYKHGALDVGDMNNISKKLKDTISQDCVLNTLAIEKIDKSSIEKTQKILFKTQDNHFIESVSMVEKDRHTICISSQIGCNVDCDFCATASRGLIRNLLAGEIIDPREFLRN